MNSRIKEIAEQAHRYANSVVKETNLFVLNVFKEKFAELIVKECSELVQMPQNNSQLFTNEAYDRGYLDGRNDAAFMIKQYFGVEE